MDTAVGLWAKRLLGERSSKHTLYRESDLAPTCSTRLGYSTCLCVC